MDVICYSDSTMDVQLVSTMVNRWYHSAAIVSNVHDLLQRSWIVQLKYFVREANTSADFMFKLGAGSSEILREFLEQPEDLLLLLHTDACQVIYHRD